MPNFNLPNEEQGVQEVFTGCPPGYDHIGDACVHPLTDDIIYIRESSGYEFQYYTNAGELIGKYYLLTSFEEDFISTPYFGQNVHIIKLKHLQIENSKQVINKEEPVFLIRFLHKKEIDEDPTVSIVQDISSLNPFFSTTFYAGEFHLLPKTLLGLNRMNLNYELLQEYKEESEFVDTLQSPIIPPLKEENEDSALIQWEFGYNKLPNRDRPNSFIEIDSFNKPTPLIDDRLTGTDKLEWQTIDPECFKYINVFDGSNPGLRFEEIEKPSGHYLCQMKCSVNEENMLEFINSNFAIEDGEEKEYNLVVYPPSIYMHPTDNIDYIITPRVNTVNDRLKEFIFEAPANYKPDGGHHYQIDFLTSKTTSDILFQTSSSQDSEFFEDFFWQESTDGEEWTAIPNEYPEFNNIYDEQSGSDSENIKQIKYIISENAAVVLAGRSDIVFRIKQFDGTKIR